MGQWLEVSVGISRMRCYSAPPVAHPAPGILVCMHGPGLDEFIQNICDRLAAAGFAVIAPDFYHRQTQPLTDAWTKIKDIEAAPVCRETQAQDAWAKCVAWLQRLV